MLTIAGSDSGGGAGIQADLKAFARCGVHGMSAITAITAQNTLAVDAVLAVAPEMILAQIRAVLADIEVDAVKVGMLGSAAAVIAVATALDELPSETPVVVDPVMVSESGARLLDRDAESALVAEILPRATILTPNMPEALALARGARPGGFSRVDAQPGEAFPGNPPNARAPDASYESPNAPVPDAAENPPNARTPDTCGGDPPQEQAVAVARAVLRLGPKIVLLTGGHREQATDLFLDSEQPERIVNIPGKRHPDGAAHGSGCTHSSIVAAQLALGRAPLQAAVAARALTGEAVGQGLRDVGHGPGPVDAIGLRRIRAELGLS